MLHWLWLNPKVNYYAKERQVKYPSISTCQFSNGGGSDFYPHWSPLFFAKFIFAICFIAQIANFVHFEKSQERRYIPSDS